MLYSSKILKFKEAQEEAARIQHNQQEAPVVEGQGKEGKKRIEHPGHHHHHHHHHRSQTTTTNNELGEEASPGGTSSSIGGQRHKTKQPNTSMKFEATENQEGTIAHMIRQELMAKPPDRKKQSGVEPHKVTTSTIAYSSLRDLMKKKEQEEKQRKRPQTARVGSSQPQGKEFDPINGDVNPHLGNITFQRRVGTVVAVIHPQHHPSTSCASLLRNRHSPSPSSQRRVFEGYQRVSFASKRAMESVPKTTYQETFALPFQFHHNMHLQQGGPHSSRLRSGSPSQQRPASARERSPSRLGNPQSQHHQHIPQAKQSSVGQLVFGNHQDAASQSQDAKQRHFVTTNALTYGSGYGNMFVKRPTQRTASSSNGGSRPNTARPSYFSQCYPVGFTNPGIVAEMNKWRRKAKQF